MDWFDCLNSPAPKVSVTHVGDPAILSPRRTGDELDQACQSTMEVVERQIWEDIERGISSHQGKMLVRPNGNEGVTTDPSLVYRAGVMVFSF